MAIGLNASSYLATPTNASAPQRRTDSATGEKFQLNLDVDITVIVDEPQPRTIDDVKREFYDFLNSLPVTPGIAQANPTVSVTDSAFQRMLEEPEFMQQMKDLCVRDMCGPAPIPPAGYHTTITDGSNGQEPYLASSWGSAWDSSMQSKKAGSFWSHRETRDDRAAARRDDDKRAREKREMLDLLQEAADKRRELLMGGRTGGAAGIGSTFRSTAIPSWFAGLASGSQS